MAISGSQQINIGLPNESIGSDSLYEAFTKTQDNFTNLFANASPVPIAGNGITVSNISNVITVSANLIAGNNIVLTNSGGAIIIDAVTGGPSGSITGVLPGTGLTGGGYSGNVTLGLATSGVTPASYTNPTITVDATGRITSASNNTVAGTVTSVGLVGGSGITISGGPVTSSGLITVTNAGVTRLTAGTGISLSSSNGNVTVSANTTSGTVTSIGVSSSQLVITGSPVVTSGTIGINLPANATFAGNVTAGNLKGIFANGTSNISIPAINGNVNVSASGNANILVITGTGVNVAGTLNSTGNANVGNIGATNANVTAMTATGNVTVGNLIGIHANGTSNIDIPAINGNVNVSASGNANILVITGTGVNVAGTLNSTGNANVGNIGATNANVTAMTATGNIEVGNLVIPTGNIFYTPRHGAFYSNVDQTNPIASTAMAMTFNNTVTANGVSVVSNSRLTIAKPGVYNIQFSAQLAKTGGGTGVVDIWLNKDGNPVDWTNTSIYVTSGNPKVAAWNFVENVTVASTFFEIMWSSPDTLITLEASAANTGPTRPGIPSVIVSVTPVGA